MLLVLCVPALGGLYDAALYRAYRPKRYPCAAVFMAAACLILICTLHDDLLVVKGVLFSHLLILAAYCDALTGEIPNEIPLLLIAVGAIRCIPGDAFPGALAVSVPLLILACVFRDSVGGGDIKLMAACGWVLGVSGVIAGAVSGILFLAVTHVVRHKKSYAMAPYFAAGCFLAYFVRSDLH